jgi:predicted dehydrogenase
VEPIKIAVVGLNFGAWMIENELLSEFAGKYVRIAAVCDAREDKAREWADKLNVPYCTDLEQLLANPEIEAAALFTGPVGRARLIEKIIEAGKHVMTTKPFENDSEEARRVLARARELGITVHLNSPAPELRGDLRQVQEWIRTLDLGRPVAFRAETTCSYREKPDGSWYDDPQLCPAAPIFRLGIYLINDCVRFFGEVEQVSVFQSRLFTGRPTADNAQLSLLFTNGALGNVFASFCIDDKQYYKTAFTMNFERGTICRNIGPRPHSTDRRPNLMQVAAVHNGRQVIESVEAESNEGYQWDVFYATVRGERTDDPAYHDQIVTGIRVIEMMKRQTPLAGG